MSKIKLNGESSGISLTDFLGQSSPSGMDAIFVVWNEFIQKIKLALLLPIMVENYKILRKCLLDTKYECISRLVEQFCAGKKDIAHDVPKCISQGADKIVEIVLTNPGILNYLPKAWFDDLSPNELKLLKCLEDIFELVQVRFPRGAFEQMDMDHEAFKNYHANKSVTKDIIYLERKLNMNKIPTLWKRVSRLARVQSVRSQLQTPISARKLNFEKEIYSIIICDLGMTRRLCVKGKDLEEKAENAKKTYATTLHNDLKQEKTVRAERTKLLIGLESLVKKYDQMMLDKFHEEVLLSEAYMKMKYDMRELEEEYERVKKKHYEMVIKKLEFAAKLKHFRFSRATVIIQRWYKLMREARKESMREEASGERSDKPTAKSSKSEVVDKKRDSRGTKPQDRNTKPSPAKRVRQTKRSKL